MQLPLDRLRGLSPFGPIFGKELRTTARRKRTYMLRFLYLGALFLLLLFFWSVSRPMNYYYGDQGSVAARAARNAELGSQFFAVFSFFTLTAMGLVGPILTATAVNSERLHKTLPVLLMTPITAWQIIAGKLSSRLLIAFTLIGLSLPVLAVVRLLGGVEVEQMWGSICLCISMAIMSAAVGLLLSTLMNRAYSVILLSYAFLFFLYFVIPFIIGLMVAAASIGGQRIERLLFELGSIGHPWMAMALLAIPDARVPFKTFSWHWCAGAHVAFAAMLVLLCALILRRMARKEAEGGGSTPGASAAVAPPPLPVILEGEAPAEPGSGSSPDAPIPAWKAEQTSGGTQRTISDNPVLWREVRRPLMNRRWQAVVAAAVVILTMLVIYGGLANIDDHRNSGGALMENEVHIGFAIVFCGLLNLLTCIVSATAIAQEKESDTWTLLLATPLTSWRIVAGKLAGLLRRMVWPVVLITAHFVIFTLAGVLTFDTFIIVMWLMLATNVTWLATGMYLSLRLKTVTFAVILNLLLPLLAYGGVAMVVGILGVVVANDDDWAEVSMVYAPYAYMAEAIDKLSDDPGMARYERNYRDMWVPAIGQVRQSDFYAFVFATGAVHLAFTALLLLWTARRFDGIVGRARQLGPPAPRSIGGSQTLT